MTRPAYRPAHSRLQPGGTTYRPPAPRRWRRVALAILLLIIAAVITVEVAALYAEHHPAAPRPPASVPTTYGAPGPNGGPVAVRAACVAP